jgi:hypothetical protein
VTLSTQIGDTIIRVTIWLALLAYAAVVWRLVTGRPENRKSLRFMWTVGCALLLLHIAASFHFVHDWRHALAVAETARQTKALIGWEFGGGVCFNYAFAALWAADVAWWWIAPKSYGRRPKWIPIALHLFMFFIAFNGAVVFAHGPVRWIGAAFTLLVGWRLIRLKARRVSEGIGKPDA